MMKVGCDLIRVFPRKTKASPCDPLAYFTGPPLYQLECRQVRVSCTFSFDKSRAEFLAGLWSNGGYAVEFGGPAYDDPGGEFIPGMFLKKGMVITSRGCPNSCDFCVVPNREGDLRELDINAGFNVMDNNLLRCSRSHVEKVFAMLSDQPEHAIFTGGFEARALQDWHVDLLSSLQRKPECVYFAYDSPSGWDPLVVAIRKMQNAGFKQRQLHCYVLIGFGDDSLSAAADRLKAVYQLGVMPFAMLYVNERKNENSDWLDLRDIHIRPARTRRFYKEV